jgi:hypothetical protein
MMILPGRMRACFGVYRSVACEESGTDRHSRQRGNDVMFRGWTQ